MKPYVIFSAVLLVFTYYGCYKTIDSTSPLDNKTSGKLLLKIDKENVPEGVTYVEAKLSRQNFDTIFASLNLLSDSTAEITLSEIPVGLWHLKVDAKDTSGSVLYSGETNVEVLAGFVVQVNLTLYATGAGTGGIYIFVTWGGTPSYNWIDYSHNPVLNSHNYYWDYLGVKMPVVHFEDNSYKMWFLGLTNAARSYIGFAVSADGESWSRPEISPVLSPGSPGTWDYQGVAPGAVIKVDNLYYLYYCGWQASAEPWHIGLATSIDGINWTKHPNPVLTASGGWEYQVIPSSVIKVGNLYYLYYYGRNYPDYKIGLAISSDGVNWERYSGNPILAPTRTWEGTGVYHPGVIFSFGTFKMVYMNAQATAFGTAISTDGKNWTKSETNPFFTRNETHNGWGGLDIAYPNYVVSGNTHRIFYSARSANSYNERIGFIKRVQN